MNIYEKVTAFYQSYKGEKRIIGKSGSGRSIYAFLTGECGPTILCQYAIHAREWVTTYLALEQIKFGVCGGNAWIVPLANPDGVLLATEGVDTVSGRWRKEMLLRVNGGVDFSLWKANADCVDLNVNFDAEWGKGKCNVFRPAPQNYVGTSPCSASETRALVNFTYRVCPRATVSYHTKGEVIYWAFGQPFFRCMRDKRLACTLSSATGYPLGSANGSAGGYKDWCIQKLHIPAFTVEVGSDELSHPLTERDLPQILERNLGSLNCLLREL